jgi:ferric-dicitrate binding protein FerR (iron transport regulator)
LKLLLDKYEYSRTAQTRAAARQLSGRFPADAVQAFRVLASTLGTDVQELANRIEIKDGRLKRDQAVLQR